MAAGLTIKTENFKIFCTEFEVIAKELLSPDDLNLIIEFYILNNYYLKNIKYFT